MPRNCWICSKKVIHAPRAYQRSSKPHMCPLYCRPDGGPAVKSAGQRYSA